MAVTPRLNFSVVLTLVVLTLNEAKRRPERQFGVANGIGLAVLKP